MFIVKALAIACAAFSLVSNTPPPIIAAEQPDVVFQNYPLIHRMDCGDWRGTGFRVSGNHWISVAHVTGEPNCKVDGAPITVTEQDGKNDFSQFDTPSSGNGLAIDCDGYKAGHWYWAIGYAFGAPFQTAVAIYATIYAAPNGQRIFVGHHTVIPGMSGGPVVDPETGKVVGTVNAYNPELGLSFSRELADTSICKGGAA